MQSGQQQVGRAARDGRHSKGRKRAYLQEHGPARLEAWGCHSSPSSACGGRGAGVAGGREKGGRLYNTAGWATQPSYGASHRHWQAPARAPPRGRPLRQRLPAATRSPAGGLGAAGQAGQRRVRGRRAAQRVPGQLMGEQLQPLVVLLLRPQQGAGGAAASRSGVRQGQVGRAAQRATHAGL
jgi:hypothetical protein